MVGSLPCCLCAITGVQDSAISCFDTCRIKYAYGGHLYLSSKRICVGQLGFGSRQTANDLEPLVWSGEKPRLSKTKASWSPHAPQRPTTGSIIMECSLGVGDGNCVSWPSQFSGL